MSFVQIVFFLLFGLIGLLPPVSIQGAESFSRLMVYDVRGSQRDETALILEQQGGQVKVWLQDYLGRRQGDVPAVEYQQCFSRMRETREFALKKEYRGKLLRTKAAHGTLTLAWVDKDGKHIKTIRYYAPEHTLDDFRQAFNHIWALSRYAILSPASLESPQISLREDAIVFLSGAGWMTLDELSTAVDFYLSRGMGDRMAGAVWQTLSQPFSPASEFSKPANREYYVSKAMRRLGPPAMAYLQSHVSAMSESQATLAKQILSARTAQPQSTVEP